MNEDSNHTLFINMAKTGKEKDETLKTISIENEGADFTPIPTRTITIPVGNKDILIVGTLNISTALQNALKDDYKMVILVPTKNETILAEFALRCKANLKMMMSPAYEAGIYLVEDVYTLPNPINMRRFCHLNSLLNTTSHKAVDLITICDNFEPSHEDEQGIITYGKLKDFAACYAQYERLHKHLFLDRKSVV